MQKYHETSNKQASIVQHVNNSNLPHNPLKNFA